MIRRASNAIRTAVVVLLGLFLVIGGCDGTSIETTAPTITGTTPANGATGVDPARGFSVTFSEKMNEGSVAAALSSVPALPPGTLSWSGNTMTFTPDAGLAGSTEYVVSVSTTAIDMAGNPLAAPLTWRWRTGLPYMVVDLQSDFAIPTSNNGVAPSADGQYLFWYDGTAGEGWGCNIHLYRVKISDLSSLTIWTNRAIWGIYDDGVDTWVGNYYPYEGARVPDADPIHYLTRSMSLGHTIALNGNDPNFANVYFGTSSGGGVGYWNRADNTAGMVGGSGAWVYQSAVIGDNVYFPKGYVSTPGIMVVDAVNDPTALAGTLLAGDPRIASSDEVMADNVFLYVRNSVTKEIHKVNPAGSGAIVNTFSPGVSFTNPVILGDSIYSGVSGDNTVYIMDKNTGSIVRKDCSAYLPTPVGSPRWDFYNDGIWYGPQAGALTDVRKAYFIPRRIIDALPAS
ncbi:MAG: Ig-like domain-containing protein [Gemmatimonadota bacterium]